MFLRLADGADVVITNFKSGTMDDWGLGYDDVAARNATVIYAAGSTFGLEGPDAGREGADLSAQAAGGLISTTGRTDGEPTPVGDHDRRPHRRPEPRRRDPRRALRPRAHRARASASTCRCSVGRSGRRRARSPRCLLTGEAGGPLEPRPPAHPRRVRHLPDGRRLAGDRRRRRPGAHPLLRGDRPARARRAVPPAALLRRARRRRCSRCSTRRSAPARRPSGASSSPQPTCATPPCATTPRSSPTRTCGPTATWPERRADGEVDVVASPVRFSDTPAGLPATAPELGQHTEEILLELGYTWDDIAALGAGGAT